MQAERYSDISIILTTFFLKSIGLWLAEDSVEKRRMKVMIGVTIFYILLSAFIESRDLYFTWFYNGDTLYILANVLGILITGIKVYVILLHRTEFRDLIKYMQDNFLNIPHDFYETRIVNNCSKTCILFICSVTTVGICAMVSYIITPFVSHAENNTTDNERMLPFNMWLNLPLSKTPYYESLLVVQFQLHYFGVKTIIPRTVYTDMEHINYTSTEIISLYYVGVCYFCFDNIFCIMSIHVAGQFRILQYRLAKLCDVESQACEKDTKAFSRHADKSYEKLKACILHHQALIDYCEKLENVYRMITLGQVTIFSVLICLFGYQVLLAACSFARRMVFICLIIGAMGLLFMFTYSCDAIIQQSGNVALGAYSTLWTLMPMNKSGKMFRKSLIMVVARSKRVCCLTANGFFPVSLETYTTILSTAVSYFTLLSNHLQEPSEL